MTRLQEFGGAPILRKTHSVGVQNVGGDLEAQERQIVFPEKRLDLDQREAMFLNVKEKVAAGLIEAV